MKEVMVGVPLQRKVPINLERLLQHAPDPGELRFLAAADFPVVTRIDIFLLSGKRPKETGHSPAKHGNLQSQLAAEENPLETGQGKHTGIPAHPGNLVNRNGEVREREMLENFGAENTVEACVFELLVEFKNATQNIGFHVRVYIDGRYLIPALLR